MTEFGRPKHRIRWSPKVPIAKVAQLYGLDAQGRQDEDLLLDLGWRLHARCQSVTVASISAVDCPWCNTRFEVPWINCDPARESTCPGCGWCITAGEYHRSFEHQDLMGGSPAFQEFVDRFPTAAKYTDRLLLIDRLVHAVHATGNTACRNLFEGRHPWKLVRALDAITASAGGASAIARTSLE